MWCRRRQIHSMSPHLSVKLRKDIDANTRLKLRNGERLPVLAVIVGRDLGCGGGARGHVNGLVNMGRHEHAALQALQLGSKKGGAGDDENVIAPKRDVPHRGLDALPQNLVVAGVLRDTPEYKTAISEKQMGWVCAASASVLIAGAVSR